MLGSNKNKFDIYTLETRQSQIKDWRSEYFKEFNQKSVWNLNLKQILSNSNSKHHAEKIIELKLIYCSKKDTLELSTLDS